MVWPARGSMRKLSRNPLPKKRRGSDMQHEQEGHASTFWGHDCMLHIQGLRLAWCTALAVDNFGSLLHMQRGANASPVLERRVEAACKIKHIESTTLQLRVAVLAYSSRI